MTFIWSHFVFLLAEELNICTCRFCTSQDPWYLRGDLIFIHPSFICIIRRLYRVFIYSPQAVEAFAADHLKTSLGEPVKGKKNKTTTELWLEKFYRKTTNLPEPFPHELVERLEKYLDVSHSCAKLKLFYLNSFNINKSCFFMWLNAQSLEEQLVDLSSLLYDHRLQDAHLNSSEILQSSIFTQQ